MLSLYQNPIRLQRYLHSVTNTSHFSKISLFSAFVRFLFDKSTFLPELPNPVLWYLFQNLPLPEPGALQDAVICHYVICILICRLKFSISKQLPIFPRFAQCDKFSVIMQNRIRLPFLFFHIDHRIIIIDFQPWSSRGSLPAAHPSTASASVHCPCS